MSTDNMFVLFNIAMDFLVGSLFYRKKHPFRHSVVNSILGNRANTRSLIVCSSTSSLCVLSSENGSDIGNVSMVKNVDLLTIQPLIGVFSVSLLMEIVPSIVFIDFSILFTTSLIHFVIVFYSIVARKRVVIVVVIFIEGKIGEFIVHNILFP